MSDNTASNPLEITSFTDAETGEERMYVPLDVLPEDVVEDLRERFVPQHTVDSTAEELGPSAPGVKDDAAEQSKKLMEQALQSPIGDQDKADKGDGPVSPADALG